MTHQQRIEFFQILRVKLDEIEEVMEAYGGREQFLSMWCFGIFVPETDESDERYEMMTGMHMAMEDEFDLMASTLEDCFKDYLFDPENNGDSSSIDYWLKK